MIAPVLEDLDSELATEAKIIKVNVDEEGELAARYGVMSIPALFVFKNGEVVDQTAGYQPKDALAELLDPHL